jgi:hypothetical protein
MFMVVSAGRVGERLGEEKRVAWIFPAVRTGVRIPPRGRFGRFEHPAPFHFGDLSQNETLARLDW